MSKDEMIKKIENIIEKQLQCKEQQDVAKETCLAHRNWCANDIYDAGFRDISGFKLKYGNFIKELKKTIEEESYDDFLGGAYEDAWDVVERLIYIFKELESL
jgi:hypothetical protein